MAAKGKLAAKAAALFCAVAVGISVMGLEFSKPTLPDGIAAPEPQKITAAVSADKMSAPLSPEETSEENKDGENEKTADSSEENDLSSVLSLPPGENSSDSGERNSINDTTAVNRTEPDSTGHSDGSDSSDSSENDSGGKKEQASDNASHADKPGDRPQDGGGETDIEYFTTSIKDGERVSEAEYPFTVTHLKKELAVKRTDVYLNGRLSAYSGSVLLSSENGGRNTIKISVTYTDKDGKVISASKSFTVYLKTADSEPQKQPATLITDLYSHTRSDEKLEFTAYVGGDVLSSKLTVYHKNKKLKPSGSVYSCTLDMGDNRISIKAVYTDDSGEHTEQLEFNVKLIAETTEETAPYLSYHNVPQEVRGSVYTLDLAPVDHTGGRLYSESLFVTLNGVVLSRSWEGEYISYLLNLSAGENSLNIRVTDSEGRYTDYSFVITCLAAADGEIIGQASLTVDANVLGLGVILPEMTFDIRQGESAARAVVNALMQNGFEVGGVGDLDGGYYLSRLYKPQTFGGAYIPEELSQRIGEDPEVYFTDNKDPDSLGDKDFTTASGWMVCVNGRYLSYGLGDLHLKDGDRVELRFTLAYGKDIGGNVGGENYDLSY
ncbi:MAG: DUF4430 domain-containing protein [Oscillospiraceae bacterium]